MIEDELKQLAKIASALDKKKEFSIANRIDKLIEKMADFHDGEEEEVEVTSETIEKLRELANVIPDREQFDVPEGSMYEEEVGDSEEEFQEETERKLLEFEDQKMLNDYVGTKSDDLDWDDDLNRKMLLENEIQILPKAVKDADDHVWNDEPVWNSRLGKGAFARVYRGVYQGKEVAAKVIDLKRGWWDTSAGKHPDSKGFGGEVDTWKRIEKLKVNLPKDIKKHFPKIHKLIKNEDFTEIVVMEVLEKPEAHVLEKIWGKRQSRAEGDAQFRKGVLNPRILYEALGKTMWRLSAINKVNNSEMINDFSKELFSFSFDKSTPSKDYIKIFKDFVEETFKKMKDKYSSEDENHWYQKVFTRDDWGSEFPSVWAGAFVENVRQLSLKIIRFPKNYRKEGTESFEEIEEIKSFFNALKFLAKKGIRWHDLHSENVMQRPGTKELVVTDVGLYNVDAKLSEQNPHRGT